MTILHQMKEAIVLLRFQTEKPNKNSSIYRSYASISRFLKMPYSTVRMTCLQSIDKK